MQNIEGMFYELRQNEERTNNVWVLTFIIYIADFSYGGAYVVMIDRYLLVRFGRRLCLCKQLLPGKFIVLTYSPVIKARVS